MEQITLRIPQDTLEAIDTAADEHGETRSEHIRDVLASHRDMDDVRAEHERELRELRADYEARITELEQETERLRNEKRLILEQREEHTELVRAVEREQVRADQRAQAGVVTRMKWWAFGMSDE